LKCWPVESRHASGGLRAVKYISLELKQAEQFENDDDDDNDSDDVEDVSVHGSWITRRHPQGQAIVSADVIPIRHDAWLRKYWSEREGRRR
jgi:hypothetical protein